MSDTELLPPEDQVGSCRTGHSPRQVAVRSSLSLLVLSFAVGLTIWAWRAHLAAQEASYQRKASEIRQKVTSLAASAQASGDIDQSAHEAYFELEKLLTDLPTEFAVGSEVEDVSRFKSMATALMSEIDDSSFKIKEAQKRLVSEQQALDECHHQKRQLIESVREFSVVRRFDTTANGEGVFESVDLSHFVKCVLLASDDVIKYFSPISVRLAAESKGRQPYALTRFNAFQNFETTEYYDTYEVTDPVIEARRIDDLELSHRSTIASTKAALPSLQQRAIESLRRISSLASVLK